MFQNMLITPKINKNQQLNLVFKKFKSFKVKPIIMNFLVANQQV
jgi:hypothetical protein